MTLKTVLRGEGGLETRASQTVDEMSPSAVGVSHSGCGKHY